MALRTINIQRALSRAAASLIRAAIDWLPQIMMSRTTAAASSSSNSTNPDWTRTEHLVCRDIADLVFLDMADPGCRGRANLAFRDMANLACSEREGIDVSLGTAGFGIQRVVFQILVLDGGRSR